MVQANETDRYASVSIDDCRKIGARPSMGFLYKQQVTAAVRLLAWQYTRSGRPLPEQTLLERQARQLVDDAHRIARKRGGNLFSILKEMAADIRHRSD
jgi:hypothetical protein